MPADEPKQAVLSIEDDLLPILIIEELVKSGEPMTVDNVSKKLGIGEAILAGQLSTLAEEGYIEAYGALTTFFEGKRLATLATDILYKSLSICRKIVGTRSPGSIFR